MKVTSITVQVRDKNRVNVSVDGKYRFSLDISQLADLGLRKDIEYTEEDLISFEEESQFGKLYMRALEYSMVRPHSEKELRDYLYRKTRPVSIGPGQTKPGVSVALTVRVFDRIIEKGYVSDTKFTAYWVENRNLKKGISKRKLTAELRGKGVDSQIIEAALADSDRDEQADLKKIIARKQSRYDDERKLIAYLGGQGFSYSIIRSTLDEIASEEDV